MAAEKVTALIRLLYLYEYDEAKVLLSSMRPLDLNTSGTEREWESYGHQHMHAYAHTCTCICR